MLNANALYGEGFFGSIQKKMQGGIYPAIMMA